MECKYQNEVKSVSQNNSNRSKVIENFGKSKDKCRICLSDEICHESDTKLINVCSCKGISFYIRNRRIYAFGLFKVVDGPENLAKDQWMYYVL